MEITTTYNNTKKTIKLKTNARVIDALEALKINSETVLVKS